MIFCCHGNSYLGGDPNMARGVSAGLHVHTEQEAKAI